MVKDMMKLIIKFPLTIICFCAIWLLCFISPPHTVLDSVSMIDKWTHVLMYAGMVGVLLFEYSMMLKRGGVPWSKIRLLLTSVIAPIIMGGVIELLQHYCTSGRRSGEWADFVADMIGVIIGVAIGWWIKKRWL